MAPHRGTSAIFCGLHGRVHTEVVYIRRPCMGSSFQYDPARRLRLVGVADSADELVLSNGDGEEFYLPITDALRNAATRPIGRPSAAAADEAAKELSPREIQAKLRAGSTIDELAAQHEVSSEARRVGREWRG